MFATYVTDNFRPLRTVEPDPPFDDLEPMLTGARVVAIGESAHWVREYTLFRYRLLRALAARGGPVVFALESGFSEGQLVSDWLSGGSGDVRSVADEGITYRMGQCAEMRDQLTWMRSAGVGYAGLDLPGSAATPLPALHRLPAGLPFVEDLITRTEKFASEHALHTYAAYAALAETDRDALTARWASLSAWADVRVPGLDPVVRHEIRLGALFDQMLRGHATRSALAAAARDRAMAETVLWLLERHPDAVIVLGAANGHLQRTPLSVPGLEVSPAGHHLASHLGPEYLAVAVTAVGGRTPARRPAPSAPGGVEVTVVDLEPPRADAIEAALPGRLGVLDLREARGLPDAPTAIRVQHTYVEGPVAEAYDFVVGVPSTTVAGFLAG
ncbi:erythromycin esterase family protein [Cryptosporangium arvum]|uniref:Erythromycin esterase-like enzyme n=1 Tax=Cryptosporangium arvum DSM 44712 TaxID=927661 RepID=A0A011AHC1_9ACTN|nr:erythromycin esterase family protein [Cryptosporangium arvum]EXG81416.1 erythromycin esterase-like enzyme [Cryptosporangium arvum DSM 44712]